MPRLPDTPARTRSSACSVSALVETNRTSSRGTLAPTSVDTATLDSTLDGPCTRVRSRSLPSTTESLELDHPLVANLNYATSAPADAPSPSPTTLYDSYQLKVFVKAFLWYLYETTWAYLFVLCTSPSSILFDPLSTFYALLVYPTLWIVLANIVFVLWIGDQLGLGAVIDRLSKERYRGYSIANWANPRIFDGSEKTIADARKMLGGTYRTTLPPQMKLGTDEEPSFAAVKTVRIFSIPLAKTFLLMSALVYERKGRFVLAAHQQVVEASEEDKSPNEKDALLAEARANLARSEESIRDQAGKWDLEFAGVCELGSKSQPDGPFASVFATSPPTSSHDLPFLVLAFKGTSVDNFAEILIDVSMDRVPAAPFFGPGSGTCHRGFYNSLFGAEDSFRASGADSYGTIVRFLRIAAARMRRQYEAVSSFKGSRSRKIPLWITAHSLGSGLAALCFARFLRSPQDLGDDIELRDCYCFATPRIGDGDFASAFENSLVTPCDRPELLWRVTLQSDVVTRLPLGIADAESSRASLSSVSPLNYAHLGPSMTLRPVSPWPSLGTRYRPSWRVEHARAFHAATDVWVAGADYEGEAELLVGNGTSIRHRSLETKATTTTMTSDWMDEFLSDTEDHPDQSRRVETNKKKNGRRLSSLVSKQVSSDDNKLGLVRALKVVLAPFYDHFPAAYLECLDEMQSTRLA